MATRYTFLAWNAIKSKRVVVTSRNWILLGPFFFKFAFVSSRTPYLLHSIHQIEIIIIKMFALLAFQNRG